MTLYRFNGSSIDCTQYFSVSVDLKFKLFRFPFTNSGGFGRGRAVCVCVFLIIFSLDSFDGPIVKDGPKFVEITQSIAHKKAEQ